MFISTHLPKVPAIVPDIHNIDLVAHFIMYGGWAALCWWVLADDRGQVSWSWIIRLMIIVAVYAAFDEATQALVGRTPAINDYLTNLGGVGLVLLILQAWSRREGRRNS